MSVSQSPDKTILTASKDLSGFTNKIMTLDASGEVVEAANSAVHPIGILMNAPTAQGQDAWIKANGVIDLVMIENCDEGKLIIAEPIGSGKGAVADADNDFGIGVALTANAGGDGETISVQIQLGSKAVAAE